MHYALLVFAGLAINWFVGLIALAFGLPTDVMDRFFVHLDRAPFYILAFATIQAWPVILIWAWRDYLRDSKAAPSPGAGNADGQGLTGGPPRLPVE